MAFLHGTIPLTNELNARVEVGLSKRFSIQGSGAVILKSPLLLMLEDSANTQSSGSAYNWLKVRGYRLQGQLRFYIPELLEALGYENLLSGSLPNGPYIAAHMSYSYARLADKQSFSFDQYIAITHYNVNFLFGMQVAISDRWLFDGYGGLGYKENVWNYRDYQGTLNSVETDDLGAYYRSNLKLMLGLSIGYAF